MRFSDEADEAAAAILRRHAAGLGEESERIANRADASEVSARYVELAAFALKLKRQGSAAADVMLSIGTTLAGVASGAGITIATASVDVGGWLATFAIGIGAVGLLLTGAGATLRLDRGR